jgi:hypothetical protein
MLARSKQYIFCLFPFLPAFRMHRAKVEAPLDIDLCIYLYLFFFETGSRYVAQACLKLTVIFL